MRCIYWQDLGTFAQDGTVAVQTCDNPEDHICGDRVVRQNEDCFGKVRAGTPAESRMYYDHLSRFLGWFSRSSKRRVLKKGREGHYEVLSKFYCLTKLCMGSSTEIATIK